MKNLPPLAQDFDFNHRLRVRWAEVDMQKVVFNAHYLAYIDCAIADVWRALFLPYESSMIRLDGDMFVKKAELEYHASARYDDVLDVKLRCAHIGRSSIIFKAGIFRSEECLVSAEMIFVYVNAQSRTPQEVPVILREVFTHHRHHEPLVQTQILTWSEAQNKALPLRFEVFVDEQGVPANLEQDEQDDICMHAITLNALSECIATARLLPSLNGLSRIGRMCVTRHLRNNGLGAMVLKALIDKAKQRGDREIELHAQCSAQGFYERLGFKSFGETFEEAGIAHQAMRLELAG